MEKQADEECCTLILILSGMIEIASNNLSAIKESFDVAARKLFSDYQLRVNDRSYRLLDIEFYYFAENIHEDIYAHKHEAQLQNGKWYFHGSGIDITIGDKTNHGGILIRAVGKMFEGATAEKAFICKEIHGPLNVKTEICSNLHGVFDDSPNIFSLIDITREPMGAGMKQPTHIVKTNRIGLNPDNDETAQQFWNSKYRYVAFLPGCPLKLKNKTQIALDMHEQYPEHSKEELNKALGSVFIK